jgi:hypothetical protein
MVRRVVAYCVAITLLGMASGVALLNCPFLISAERPLCCHDTAPKKCPLSNSFETCPYVALDSNVEHAHGKILSTPPPAIGQYEAPFPLSRFEGEPVAWTPSLTDLHIRIRVLLI